MTKEDPSPFTRTLGEAPSETEFSPALLRIGCVLGVQPDKWQRRWQENRPDVSTSWDFMDSSVQWEGLRSGRWSIVLARMTVLSETTEPVDSAESTVPAGSVESSLSLLSYGAGDVILPPDLTETTHVVELYQERWVVVGRKRHDIGLVSEVTLADLADLPDKRVGKGDLIVPVGQPEVAVTYAESGAGIAVLPESMVKVVGQGEGTVRLLDMEPTTRVCAVWLKDRTDGCADGCSEELIQDFIGMLRGRRAHSSRSSVATQAVSHTCDDMGLSTKQARKRVRQEKIRASRAQSQEQRKQRIAARHAAKRAAQKRGKRR